MGDKAVANRNEPVWQYILRVNGEGRLRGYGEAWPRI
jgi:hypothetical protein